MPAAFEFVNYQITNISYKVDPDVDIVTSGNEVGIEASLARNNESPELFRLTMNINVHGNPSVNFEINGFFRLNDEYIAEETEHAIMTWGSSIIYPYARAAISSISVLDGGQPIVIRTMNFFDNLNVEKISEDEVDRDNQNNSNNLGSL